MNYADRLFELAQRRERLLARVEQQRSAIAAEWQAWEKPAALVDRGVAVAGFLKSHPLLIAIGVAAVVVLRLHKLRKWLGRGWMLWRVWRSAGAWLRRMFA
ncbi:MAG TPA: YqjK-like family protein [Burkholderiales bacterium]|nr:YqjK-like family protein [Burkholderiales bacterium]